MLRDQHMVSLLPRGFSGDYPPTAGWTGDNTAAGAGTQSFTQGYIHSTFTQTNAVNTRVYYRTAPGGAYTVTALLDYSMGATNSNPSEVGYVFGFRDGTGKMVTWFVQSTGGTAKIGDAKWTSTTSFSAYYAAMGASGQYKFPAQDLAGRHPLWLRIADDSTTSLTFSYSLDGANWVLFDTEGRTDWFASGPTQICYGGYTDDSPAQVNVLLAGTVNEERSQGEKTLGRAYKKRAGGLTFPRLSAFYRYGSTLPASLSPQWWKTKA